MNRLADAFNNAFKSLKRNLSVTMATVATMAATIFIFGIFLMVALSINSLVRNVEEQTVVRVFLTPEATNEQRGALETLIRAQAGVTAMTFEDKVTAFNNAKAGLDEDSHLLDGFSALGNNPYPDSYIVELAAPEHAAPLTRATEGQTGVESVANDSDTVNMLISWAKTIRAVGVIIFGILILVSLFLIGNAIKLAVVSRREEIEIMKFVGATNWYIRWPFIIEGVVMGLLGAALAVLALYFAYRYAYGQAQLSFPFVALPLPSVISQWLSWQFLLAGASIGALGSFFSIRRHLNV